METQETITLHSDYDQTPLSVLITRPEGESKATVQIAHGMCEHKERYLPFMTMLSAHGYTCVINDHRGHGKSCGNEKDLGYFGKNGGEALVEDLHQITTWIRQNISGRPLVLFGHSMGSLAVRCYARSYDDELAGLIVCGCPSYTPASSAGMAIVKSQILLKGPHGHSKMLDNMVLEGYNKPFAAEGKRNAWISSDPAVVDAYNADPHCGFPFTLNGYESLMWLVLHTYQEKGWQMKNKALPIRFISGALDPCRINDKAFEEAASFLRTRGYQNVTTRLFPNMRHEILNEVNKQIVYDDILNTLSACIS